MIMLRFLHLILVIMVAHFLVISAEQKSYWAMAACVVFGSMLTSMWTARRG
jgi:hypothetical protein